MDCFPQCWQPAASVIGCHCSDFLSGWPWTEPACLNLHNTEMTAHQHTMFTFSSLAASQKQLCSLPPCYPTFQTPPVHESNDWNDCHQSGCYLLCPKFHKSFIKHYVRSKTGLFSRMCQLHMSFWSTSQYVSNGHLAGKYCIFQNAIE